ncbi:glycosyltransferase [Mongoliitalea daihaiensis]|uniref:glycosyltransferase n=1 Tax=Mongoliitalea daihaiensis TaxID=2782006 RepID=UPI001F25EF2F|nr:glycosyltransferase [Mongoliitalea daihaiensis]UJP64457.1 glycosyltransferase [Mongoliitalea daihaiensis]
MKLLQINSTLGVGSTGRIVEDLGAFVIANDGESIVAFGRSARKSKSKTLKIGSKLDQLNHLVQTRAFDTHGFHSERATAKLINQISEINPDLIHLHNLHGYYLNVELLFDFLKKYGKPVVWTLHDCWAFTGHCCYYERVGCDKWKTQCHTCPLSFLYPESIGLDNSKNNFIRKKASFQGLDNLTIVAVSSWLESQVKQSFLKEYPVQAIYNGIDLDVFKPKDHADSKKKLGLSEYKVILGVANEWSDGKGLRIFLEVAKYLDDNYRVVLIGLSENQIKNLPRNILGYQKTRNIEELVVFYDAADVFVSPSIAETFGMVVAEALSCGTPCVVNDSSALPELVSPKVGEIVTGLDPQKFLKSIQYIITQGKVNYSENCRKRAEKLFGLDKHLNTYFNLYTRLVQ